MLTFVMLQLYLKAFIFILITFGECLYCYKMAWNQSSPSLIPDKASFTHTISNFKNLGKFTWTPSFFSENGHIQFQFGIDPKSSSNVNVSNTCITFWCNQKATKYEVQYQVSIVDFKKNNLFTKDYKWNYDPKFDDNRNVTTFMSYNKLIDESNSFVINNTLTLSFKIAISDNDSDLTKQATVPILPKLSKDFYAILENGDFSDFALVIGDKEFKVHKAIMAVRSSVFKVMFSTDLEEKKRNRVEITDIDVEVFEQLLAYIYSGVAPKMNEYALELFIASDKYQFQELKSQCGQSLSSSLTVETVANILLHADMHTAPELKAKCIKFITANSIQVMATDGWRQLMKVRFELMTELYADLAKVHHASC